jgi:hypothetical protein
LLAEQLKVKEVVNRALCFVSNLEKKVEEPVENQVAQLAEAIH